MEFTQIWTVRKLSLRRSISGVRFRVTRPNSDEIGRLNIAVLKLILNRHAKHLSHFHGRRSRIRQGCQMDTTFQSHHDRWAISWHPCEVSGDRQHRRHLGAIDNGRPQDFGDLGPLTPKLINLNHTQICLRSTEMTHTLSRSFKRPTISVDVLSGWSSRED